jgi:UDP-N-acetylglucosamine 1-carboxyvinyltransferase
MKWIEVQQSGPLSGTVCIPGSKNSSLALLAAACLSDEPLTLKGIPNILDFRVITEIAEEMGMTIERLANGDVWINPQNIHTAQLNHSKTSAYRASYYFVGALLAKKGKVSIGYPGGDNFVSRPIDQHIKALKQMGAKFTFFDEYYVVEAEKLQGAIIYFDMITSGATINAMLAAALADGRTELRNAAKDPEVVDTANLLNYMGAKVTGAGTDTIKIDGVTQLGGCTYNVIPDRLIAGAFLMAAGATRGTITIDEIIPEHLQSCMLKLEEVGMHFEIKEHSVIAYGDVSLKATRVRTGMYPAFATDLQQPMTSLLLRAPGRSIITDKVYPERYNHLQQLRKMGAQISLRGGSAFIQGGAPLIGTYVHASDVRAGTCLIIAGLMAEGKTMIAGVEHIERGYDNVMDQFRRLGAKLLVHDHINEGINISKLAEQIAAQ